MATKVAILGTVQNSRIMAPYDDPEWDIWCCSAGNSQQLAPPRVTEWFELHSLVDLHAPENKSWYPPYVTWLNAQQFPVWMQEKNEDVPRAQVFPRRALMERFGPNKTKTNWFTSTPAWMFAAAIMRGYTTIGVFGIDMAAAEEHYTGQKAGLLRWFEIGRELGLKVIVPLESTLAFDYPLYGYAESSRAGRALLVRETELLQQIQQCDAQARGFLDRAAFFRGAYEQVKFDRRTYVSGVNDAEIDEDLEPLPQSQMSREQQVKFSTPQEILGLQVTTTRVPTMADFEGVAGADLLQAAAAPQNEVPQVSVMSSAFEQPPMRSRNKRKTAAEVNGAALPDTD